MKNYEKYEDLVIESVVNKDRCKLAAKAYGTSDCGDRHCSECRKYVGEWLKEEYKPQIDWSKVPVDTPVITNVGNRHFCKYENDRVFTFDDGTTSWTYRSEYGWTTPRNKTTVQLARPEDIEKYSI